MGATPCQPARPGLRGPIRFYLRAPKYHPQSVFAIPLAASPNLDAAILQMYEVQNQAQGPKLSTPQFLEISRKTAEELNGTQVYTLGHPNLGLKKWGVGSVYQTQGQWIFSNEFTLPGNSGSPLLDENGKIVGIHHSLPRGHGDITASGLRHQSIGTASAPLQDLLVAAGKQDAPGLSLFSEIGLSVSRQQFLSHPEKYLRAHSASVSLAPEAGSTNLAETKIHPADLIGEDIDEKLALNSITNADELEDFSSRALNALYWIDCQTKPTPAYKICPTGADKDKWLKRFSDLFNKTKEITGERDYYIVSESAFNLENSNEETADLKALEAVTSRAGTALDFNLANQILYYSRSNNSEYFGASVKDYVFNYSTVRGFEFNFKMIISNIGLLLSRHVISESDARSAFDCIQANSNLTLSEKLQLERTKSRNQLLN